MIASSSALVIAAFATLALAGGAAPTGQESSAAVDAPAPTPSASASVPLLLGDGDSDATIPADAASELAAPTPAWPGDIPLPEGATPDDLYAAKLTYSLVSVPSSRAQTVRDVTAGTAIVISARADATDFAVPNARVDAVRAVLPGIHAEPNSPSVPPAGDQTPTPSWGLDAIDSELAQQNNHYQYDTTGEGVTAYVIDTGLRMDHTDFSGRVLAGMDYIRDGYGTWDCWGHGTHVTGTIAGTTYGVAKKALVMPLRVYGCKGSNAGTNMDNFAALSWVIDNRSPRRAVINMSFTMGQWAEFDAAVRRGTEAGFIITESAGNDRADACAYSSGRTGVSMVVGATSSGGSFASGFSNYGPCVNALAPGNWIVSDSWPRWTASMYGTSMSAPHVSGLAARLLETHPDWKTPDIMAFFSRTGSGNRVSGVPAGTPNRFANIPPWPRALTTTAAVGSDGSAEIAWTTNAFGTFTRFTVTVTDMQTGRSYPVTVSGGKRSARFSAVAAGHSYSVTIGGSGKTPDGADVPFDTISTTFSG